MEDCIRSKILIAVPFLYYSSITNSKVKQKYSPQVSDNKMGLLEDVQKVEPISYYFSHTPGN